MRTNKKEILYQHKFFMRTNKKGILYQHKKGILYQHKIFILFCWFNFIYLMKTMCDLSFAYYTITKLDVAISTDL